MLHPQSRAAIDAAAGEISVSDPAFDVDAARVEARELALAQPREDTGRVTDVSAGGVPVRVYRPEGARGVVLHVHGGGFALNDIEVHDAICRRLANASAMHVVSVDYRRPPEHPYPAAVEDLDAVLEWLAAEGEWAGLGGPLFAHGDSAGATLALVAALRNPGRFAATALIYPFLDPSMSGASYDTETQGFARDDARWYWEQYAGGADRLETLLGDPDFAPLHSDRLASLPPTLVVTAEHDLLRDEGEQLAAQLAEEGVEVVATRYLGMVHGFWRHPTDFDAAEALLQQVISFLRMHRD